MNEVAQGLLADIIADAPAPSKTIQELAEESLIPQGIEIPKPESIFSLDDIPLFTKKSISTLIGKAKSGKTTCTAWVTAQVLRVDIRVLWIDTEQGDYYGSRTQSWVLSIADMQLCPNLLYYDLRKRTTPERGEILCWLIENMNPDLVILDGVRDIVFDINDAVEATTWSGKLMALADIHDCHILSILHQNKGNEHARGHLGSEMINKSETVIKVSQDERKFTICEPEFTRGKPFSPFAFDRDEYGRPVLIDYQPKVSADSSNTKKLLPVDIADNLHIERLIIAFGEEKEVNYGQILLAVSAAWEMYGTPMGVVKVKGYVQYYIQNKFILKTKIEKNKTYYEINYKK